MVSGSSLLSVSFFNDSPLFTNLLDCFLNISITCGCILFISVPYCRQLKCSCCLVIITFAFLMVFAFNKIETAQYGHSTRGKKGSLIFSSFILCRKKMPSPILEVVESFLNDLLRFKDDDIQTISPFMPVFADCNAYGITKILNEIKLTDLDQTTDKETQILQSQPVKQAGGRQEPKRGLESESDDEEDSVTVTPSKKAMNKKQKTKNTEDELLHSSHGN
jgi:hypothetical protein